MTVEEKAEQFTGDLLAYELKQGLLRGYSLGIEQFQAYTDAHHKGSIFSFFKSIWKTCSDMPSPREHYHFTLNKMWTTVWKWWRKAA